MKHLIRSLAMLILLNSNTILATNSLKDEMIEVDKQFFTAVFSKPDPATVEKMLAPNFTFNSNGKSKTRKHFLKNLEGMWQQMK